MAVNDTVAIASFLEAIDPLAKKKVTNINIFHKQSEFHRLTPWGGGGGGVVERAKVRVIVSSDS